jgi:hypothetical protein
MAWPKTRYAQTLEHFSHQTSSIFGGNKTGRKEIPLPPFVLTSSAGLRFVWEKDGQV